jgi:hypothetical protein
MYLTSISTASVDVGDRGGKGIPVLEMSEEDGELHPLHAEVAPIKLVVDAGKCIRNVVELTGKFGVFVFKAAVLVYLGDCGWVVELVHLFDEGVETSISAGENGKEPQSCCLSNGGLSIVRPEKKLCDVGGFLRLPPGQ